MKKAYRVTGEWGCEVIVAAPDGVSEEAMQEAALDDFQDGFDLKDFMRGLTVEVIPDDELEGSYTVAVLDEYGNVDDWTEERF